MVHAIGSTATAANGTEQEVLASDLADDPSREPTAEPVRARATARRRRRWGEQAALASSSAVALGVFLGLARTIAKKPALMLDEELVRAVGRARGPITNVVGRAVTFLGSVPGASLVTATALVLTREKPRLAAQVMTGAVGGIIAEVFMKRFFRRSRPTLLAHLEDVGSTSFPSGHAMASASLYLTLAFVASRSRALRDRRAQLIAGTSGLALAVSASRVFLGVHWPTDVLGGFALGTAWACLTEASFDLTAADQLEGELAASSAGVSAPT